MLGPLVNPGRRVGYTVGWLICSWKVVAITMRRELRERRRELRQRARQVLGAVLLALVSAAGLAAWLQRRSSAAYAATSGLESERLLAGKAHSSSASGSEELDGDCAGLQPWELDGGVFVYIAVLVYNFIALAIIADDYFVSSLEKITDKLELSQDVAGATFMAAGSSAPELFVSLADNVFDEPKESLGIGTIVGSAIFNILIIIGLSAALAGQPLVLDWRPMLRDSIWYSWSILLLAYSIWDGAVDTTESVALFCSYFCYIAYMSQNERVVGCCCKRPDDSAEDDRLETAKPIISGAAIAGPTLRVKEDTPLVVTDPPGSGRKLDISSIAVDVEQLHFSTGKHIAHKNTSPSWIQRAQTSALDPHHHDGAEDHEEVTEDGVPTHLNPVHLSKYRVFQSHPHLHQQSSPTAEDDGSSNAELPHEHQTTVVDTKTDTSSSEIALVPEQKSSEEPDTGYFDEIMDVPSGMLAKLWYVFTLPIVLVARLTIPDCRFPRFSGVCGFTSSFIICIIWIGILSHYTVAWGTKIGCIAGIPSALMGLTIIAAGASIPDALSSILVARDGHGDMAVSNALGSNVFDILLGLGFPFFLSNLVYKKPVAVSTDDLDVSVAILFAVLIFLVFLLVVTRWRLHPRMGAALLLMYCVYVAFTYLHGLGKI